MAMNTATETITRESAMYNVVYLWHGERRLAAQFRGRNAAQMKAACMEADGWQAWVEEDGAIVLTPAVVIPAGMSRQIEEFLDSPETGEATAAGEC